MDVAAEFAAQTAAVQKLWSSSRRSQLATLSAMRCEAAAPLLGADLRRAVAVEQPVTNVSHLCSHTELHLVDQRGQPLGCDAR